MSHGARRITVRFVDAGSRNDISHEVLGKQVLLNPMVEDLRHFRLPAASTHAIHSFSPNSLRSRGEGASADLVLCAALTERFKGPEPFFYKTSNIVVLECPHRQLMASVNLHAALGISLANADSMLARHLILELLLRGSAHGIDEVQPRNFELHFGLAHESFELECNALIVLHRRAMASHVIQRHAPSQHVAVM